MKNKINFILIIALLNVTLLFSQNTASKGNTWYKINSRGKYITQIKASGHYAVHDVIVHLINQNWNTAELTYISEFNYNHKRIKLEWGYIGSGSSRFLAVRVVPVTADYASNFEFKNISNPNYDYGLEQIDASLVTPITPKNQLFIDEWTGNIGIGTNPKPSVKLDVNGGIRIRLANNKNNNSPALMLVTNDDFLYDEQYINRYAFGFHSFKDNSSFANGANSYVAGYFGIDFFTASSHRMRINYNGNVGIGTTKPDSKLTVAGKIHAREVKVTVKAGADFVFNDDYNLLSLEKLEHYIKTNKHLPEIASEKEMLDNGLLLAEMNIKLLQKIEELTLYTIQQQKLLELQSKAIEKQSVAIKELQEKFKN